MSSTIGIQNYLSNVFHPVYSYDTITTLFTPRLELSNIDTYSGNTIAVFTAAVGDSNSNVYVGSNAGTPFNVPSTNFFNTALGYAAGSNISNTSNSVFIGWFAGAGGANSTDVISIGTNSGGNGSANIFIGTNTGTVGQSNVLIGHYINPSNVSNQIRIGYRDQIPIAADLCLNWVGIGGLLAPVNLNDKFDVSGNAYFLGNVGINIAPGTRTLDVNGNFRAQDASLNVLDFNSGLTSSSGGFVSFRGTMVNVFSGSITPLPVTLKKGLMLTSVSSGTTEFDGRLDFVLDPTTPIVSNLSSNKSAGTAIGFTGSNIAILNTSGSILDYTYSITYFPMP